MHPALSRLEHRPWPVPAETLRPLIPDALELQQFAGSCWLGLVPFRMAGVMRRPLPDLPWVSAFPELNVRTYGPALFLFEGCCPCQSARDADSIRHELQARNTARAEAAMKLAARSAGATLLPSAPQELSEPHCRSGSPELPRRRRSREQMSALGHERPSGLSIRGRSWSGQTRNRHPARAQWRAGWRCLALRATRTTPECVFPTGANARAPHSRSLFETRIRRQPCSTEYSFMNRVATSLVCDGVRPSRQIAPGHRFSDTHDLLRLAEVDRATRAEVTTSLRH
jgi:Uncharacterized conserved protein (COG2071)